MQDVILITVSGEDKPGQSASLLGVLAQYEATILDIGQAVIHSTLSLGILTQVPEGIPWDAVARELLFQAYELDLKIKFKPITPEEYNEWTTAQGKQRHIITLLGTVLNASHMARLTRIMRDYGLNIDVITRLSGRIPLEGDVVPTMACVEFSVRGTPRDQTAMRGEFLTLSHEMGIDIAFQVDDVYRRNRRLVVFDMDSTLVKAEAIDEMARAAGVGETVASITAAAMAGDIDFEESLTQRLAALKGLDESVLAEVARGIPLMDGAERLIDILKHLGFKIAVISGGFTYFARHLQQRLGFDYIYANELEIVDGKLTGNIVGEIVNAQRKAEIVREIAKKEDIRLAQVVAVGDGANDLPMLAEAGLGIAFRAKPIVRETACQALSTVGLDGILYLIGVRDRETLDRLR